LHRQRERQQPQQESFQNPIHPESLAWRVRFGIASYCMSLLPYKLPRTARQGRRGKADQ
jgi:hypothetical protein